MNDNKTRLRKLLYEHNIEANALLHASYNELDTAITRYLNFIEGCPLIKTFIDDIVANHTPEGFNASDEIGCGHNGYSTLGPFPPDYEGESAVVYLLLRAMVADHACNKGLLLGYAHGSNKFNDMAKNFLEEVARRLISGVSRTITLKGIEMGLDSNTSQFNYFGNHGGAIATMASDSAEVTVSQTNGASTEELASILKSLTDSANELEVERRQTALNAIDAMREALAEQNPKPSIVKTVMGTLKGFNECASFAKHVESLASYLLTNLPGLLG